MNFPVLPNDIHEDLITLSKQGCLVVEMIGHLADKVREINPDFKLSKQKFYDWVRIDPKLEETLKLCDIYREKWWVKECRVSLHDPKFNPVSWYMVMKNSFGWADRPSERRFDMRNWEGKSIEERIDVIDGMLVGGELVIEQYLFLMKSLHYHSVINEIVCVNPVIANIQLDLRKNAGEISADEYNQQRLLLDTKQRAREVAAERIAKETKVLSKFDIPCKRRGVRAKTKKEEEKTLMEEVQKRMSSRLNVKKIEDK